MKVTVLIATRNRSSSLARTLESLFCSRNQAAADWEAVVIDNGSTDSTSSACASFRAQFPSQFRYYREAKKGKSNALNLGIAAARGDILAFTDDDVICPPGYISAITSVFDRYPIDAVQGRILLRDSEDGMPHWLSTRQREFMGLRDCGDQIQMSSSHHLTGANMAVRAQVVRAMGGFAPELGAGSPVGFSEDTEFSLRLRNAGYKVIYAPQILVLHHFPIERLTRGSFRKRYFLLGRSRAYYGPYVAPFWRFGLYVAKHWLQSEAKAARYRRSGHPAEAMDCQCEARFQTGFFWQHCLFWAGVPRRLTRITSWPEQEQTVQKEIKPPPDRSQVHPARVAQG